MAAEGGVSEVDSVFYVNRPDADFETEKDSETLVFRHAGSGSDQLRSENTMASSPEGNAEPEESETRLCGWLLKCGSIGFMKTAKNLWFVFGEDTCKLYYYRRPQDLLPLGEIDIKHASFSFDANSSRPGLFEIRSEGKVYYLDAQGQHRMTFWLEELQKKRRLYSQRRKMISSEKISWTLKHHRKGSGLTGSGKGGTDADSSDTSLERSTGSVEQIAPDAKPVSWSLLNLRTEIRDAISSIRTPVSPISPVKSSPPGSPKSNSSRSSWTLLDDDQDSNTQPSIFIPPSSGSQSSGSSTSNSKFGSKRKFSLFSKPGKRSVSDSSTANSKEQSPRRHTHSSGSGKSGSQHCFRCKVFQEDLWSVREDLKAAEEELEANREIIKLLQKELDVVRVTMETRKGSEGKTEEEKEFMLQQRDKHVVELEHSLAVLQEDKAVLEQQARVNDGELEQLKDQVAMLQDMLTAKDEIVMQLTNQIFELENNNTQDKGGTTADDGNGDTTAQPSRATLFLPDTKELETLRDSVRAYQLQNKFLTKEIMELNELRKIDEKREKELLINYANLEALFYQTKSKYLYLLNEKNEPVRGGDESKSQETVTRLLQEALEVEEGEEAGQQDARQAFFTSQNMEYDRYGFLASYRPEEETDDILLAKANQLQRQSDELANRLKDADETTSKHVKWENFMVGQSGKPLQRSPELKALVRLGIPHEYKEHIWKGCINLYVGQTRDKLGPLYYKKDLGERIKSSRSNPAAKQIELDLLRTLPSNRHFDSLESDGVPKLRRVLLSYSVHNPLIGYCQGLNRLAAIALLFLSEEDAFWCLEALVEHIMPRDYYTKTLAAAQADQRVLKELVAEKLPKLHNHFEQHEVDLSLYTFNWFLTIFVDNVRPDTFLRCWDALLYEGSKVLFRFALAFLKYAEDEILTLREAPHIYRYMRMLGEKITNVKRITQIAFHDLNPFPMRSITSKRLHHLQLVREELRELDLIRQDFQSAHDSGNRDGFISDDDLDDARDEDDRDS